MNYTVLITGTNRGLGLEFVEQYSQLGWKVLACCRDLNNANELFNLQKKFPSIEILELDVGNLNDINVLSNKLKDRTIDVLINNAGIYRSGTLGSVDPKAWIESFKINTIAPYILIEALISQIMKSDLKKIISITSKMGSIDDNTSGGSYIYRTSKTALNSMMRSLTHDLASKGISTLTLHPGWVRTDMGGSNAWINSSESVIGMIKQIKKLSQENSGRYLDYAGKTIKW
ncbi:SDR family oxidoreductase [Methylophilaceae bacterium]|jgi:NAD(P)-dependent dehydrogenase (short-subunit alcohol dehydrogenase family)|nr:SDR family oxidoreductase [Methylophilaceae bacterium]|tara:strand:- start:254 stop:943 length:690 start_codon:yes stop_codon:yes gene_type:complete